MTFGVHIAGLDTSGGLYWVLLPLERSLEIAKIEKNRHHKGTKSRFLGLSERFGDYILQSKVVVDDIWRIYSGFKHLWGSVLTPLTNEAIFGDSENREK